MIRDYSQGDYTSINAELETFTRMYLHNYSERSVNEDWLMFKLNVAELTNHYIPLRTIKSNAGSPWSRPSLRRLLNEKKNEYYDEPGFVTAQIDGRLIMTSQKSTCLSFPPLNTHSSN